MQFWQTVTSRRKVEFGRKELICHLVVLEVAGVEFETSSGFWILLCSALKSWGFLFTVAPIDLQIATSSLHQQKIYKMKNKRLHLTYNKGHIRNIWYFPLQICLSCERRESGRQTAVLSGHSPGRRRFCYREHPAKQVFYNVFHSPEIAPKPPVTHQVILSGK